MDPLSGKLVRVTVSDPWEFAKPNGSTRFKARIVQSRAGVSSAVDALLIELTEVVEIRGQAWRYFMVEGRRDRSFIDELLAGSEADCALLGVVSNAGQAPPLVGDSSTWRGETPAAAAQLRLF